MARQADGSAWQGDGVSPARRRISRARASCRTRRRLIEEIDRFEVEESGFEPGLAAQADFEFFRAVPSGGLYERSPETAFARTSATDDIGPEKAGRDFFPYRPARFEPPPEKLAHLTNVVQDALSSGRFDGGIWLEGSPYVEETAYWLHLLLDIDVPLVCTAGNIGPPSRRNVVDAVRYLCSGIALDENGRDRVGVVSVIDEMIISARELQKADERPGGFIATGGHGGILGTIGRPGPAVLDFRPGSKAHVNLRRPAQRAAADGSAAGRRHLKGLPAAFPSTCSTSKAICQQRGDPARIDRQARSLPRGGGPRCAGAGGRRASSSQPGATIRSRGSWPRAERRTARWDQTSIGRCAERLFRECPSSKSHAAMQRDLCRRN